MFGPMPILYRAERAERAEPNPQLARLGKDRAEQSPLPDSGPSRADQARFAKPADIEFSIALVDQEQSFFYLTSIELNSTSD